MLGLFLLLPVFSLHAEGLPGGDRAFLVGLSLGMFNIVQAFFHIPLGALSDRIGRRPVVVGGLICFVLGALIAARQSFEAGDLKTAKAQLSWAADKGKDEIRDLARLRLASVLLDEKAYDEALKQLESAHAAAFAARAATRAAAIKPASERSAV